MDQGLIPVALLMILDAASKLLQEALFVDIGWSNRNRTICECSLRTRIHEGELTVLYGLPYQRPLTCLNNIRRFVYRGLTAHEIKDSFDEFGDAGFFGHETILARIYLFINMFDVIKYATFKGL